VPAGSGVACVRHAGAVTAACPSAGLALAAGPVESAPASMAAAATRASRPVRLILIGHPSRNGVLLITSQAARKATSP
jgi:hypothetical protein